MNLLVGDGILFQCTIFVCLVCRHAHNKSYISDLHSHYALGKVWHCRYKSSTSSLLHSSCKGGLLDTETKGISDWADGV